MNNLEPTIYYDEFLRYYKKAEALQNRCNLGKESYAKVSPTDSLMANVTIYDTVQRRHAGFSNMLQDLWHGTNAPKAFRADSDRARTLAFYNSNQKRWDLPVWLYLFMVHRVTGSGASFESDHGYRNTILPKLAEFDTIAKMAQCIAFEEKPIFTSVGNQIPAFNKPTVLGYETGGKQYLCEMLPRMANDLANHLMKQQNKMTIRGVVDWMLDWNTRHGWRRFKFVLSAVGADIADYFPWRVDPHSSFYHGKNAVEALGYMFKPLKRMSQEKFLDQALAKAAADVGGYEYDVEDVCCDTIRWIENYIPLGKKGSYRHLDLDAIWNDSVIRNHSKGRQRAVLELGLLPTFKGISSFGDHSVLEKLNLEPSEYVRMVNEKEISND